jgi:hypothetical protein
MSILDTLRALRVEISALTTEVDALKREIAEAPATSALYTELRTLVIEALDAYDEGVEESFGVVMVLLREAL